MKSKSLSFLRHVGLPGQFFDLKHYIRSSDYDHAVGRHAADSREFQVCCAVCEGALKSRHKFASNLLAGPVRKRQFPLLEEASIDQRLPVKLNSAAAEFPVHSTQGVPTPAVGPTVEHSWFKGFKVFLLVVFNRTFAWTPKREHGCANRNNANRSNDNPLAHALLFRPWHVRFANHLVKFFQLVAERSDTNLRQSIARRGKFCIQTPLQPTIGESHGESMKHYVGLGVRDHVVSLRNRKS
jgi:hypothetical protein